MEFSEQKSGLLNQSEEVVFGERAVELLRAELVFATFEREHVPLLALSIEEVDHSDLLERVVGRRSIEQRRRALCWGMPYDVHSQRD